MGLIKEPKDVDLSTKSEPWTEQELADFRKIMQGIKSKNAKKQHRLASNKLQKSTEVLTATGLPDFKPS